MTDGSEGWHRRGLGWRSASTAILTICLMASAALSQPAGKPPGPWRHSVEAGAGHLFEADGDDGGSVAITRSFFQPTIAYAWDRQTSIGLSAGVGLDDYDFNGSSGLLGLSPWNRIVDYGLSLPTRFGVSPKITALAIPSINWTAETGADLDDAMSVGGVVGVTYQMSGGLRIGPALAVSSGIEEGAEVIPILLVDWDVNDSVSVSTGGGSGLAGGPTVTLSWKRSDALRLGLGVSYETRRFRLDDEGVAPDGVGEDKAVSVTASATYRPLPFIQAQLLGGLAFARELELEDEDGDRIANDKVDPTPFIGFTLGARW